MYLILLFDGPSPHGTPAPMEGMWVPDGPMNLFNSERLQNNLYLVEHSPDVYIKILLERNPSKSIALFELTQIVKTTVKDVTRLVKKITPEGMLP